jgi:hypothetical protein
VSPSRRRKTTVALLLAVAAVAVVAAAAFLVGPRLTGDTTAGDSSTGTAGAAPATGSAAPVARAAATTTAPYTIRPEPTKVATDAPVHRTGGQVDVALTYVTFDKSAGTVQANGFVAGIIEQGGTCTLTLTKGGSKVTATSTAEADATTTNCGLLETSGDLAAGTWNAVLAYSSAKATGTSAAREVTVP